MAKYTPIRYSIMNRYQKSPAQRLQEAYRIAEKKQKTNLYSLNTFAQPKRASGQRGWGDSFKDDPLFRTTQTVGRLSSNVTTGALKSVEGVVDFLLGIGGGIAGIFSDEAKDAVQDVISFDATEEWIGKHLDNLTQYSYTTEGKAGEILENVASGVGQMLPAVAVTIATAGAGAPAFAAQSAGLATTAVGAAGSSTEEAYNDGASYYKGLGYGALRGATEAATEKLVGNMGGKLFGKGLADDALKGLTKTVGGRIATEAVGEGVEEAVSELATPLTKSIYKGRDAFKEYGGTDYWKGVGESALIGGLTSVVHGQTTGRILNKGKNAQIDIDQEIIKDLNKKYAEGKTSTEEMRKEMDGAVSDIERVLKKATPEKREKWIKNHGLSNIFESDGSVKADFAAQSLLKDTEIQTDPQAPTKEIEATDGEHEAPTNVNKQSMGEGIRKFQKSATASMTYQSPSLWLRQSKVESDLNEITENLRSSNTENSREGDVAPIKVFSGELTEKGEEAFSKLKKSAYILSEKTKGGFDLAIVEPNSDFDGALHNGTMYISADTLEKGTWVKPLIEETTHFTEGTKEYAKYVQFLAKDPELMADALDKIVDTEDSQKGYGFTKELAEGAVGKLSQLSKKLEDSSQTMPQYSLRYTTNNKAVAVVERDIFEGKFGELTETERVKKAKQAIKNFRPGIPISGRLIGVTRKTAEHFANSDYTDKLRNNDSQVYEDKLNIAQNIDDVIYASTDYINEDLKHTRNDNIVQFARGSVLLDIGGKQYDADVIVGITKENETVLYDVQNLKQTKFDLKKQKAQPTLAGKKSSTRKTVAPSIDSIPESSEKVNTSEEDFLNDEETEFLSEWNAHASAELLGGNEEFVDKLIREDTGLAQKLFDHIKTLVKSVENINNPEARAEYQRLKKAEKLFLKAVSKAGGQYVNGKIVMRREEEEKKDESLSLKTIVNQLSDQELDEGKRIEEFIFDVNNMLEQSKKSKRKHKVGKISSTQGEIIDSLMQTIDPNFSSEGYELWIDGTGAEHINERHGENGQADRSMATAEAKMLIPWGANNAEKGEFIRDSSGNLRRSTRFFNADGSRAYEIRVQKAMDGDTIYVSECVPDSSNKRIYITSAYIKKGSANQLLNMDAETSPQLTPKASFDGSTTTDSIPDSEKNVKRKTQFSRKSSPQQDKDTANRNQKKVYTQKDARSIIRTIVGEQLGFGKFYGKMSGKNQEYAVNWLWEALNQAELGKRAGVANNIAEYILQTATMESIYDEDGIDGALETLDVLRPYLHKMDLDGIRGEIKHRFDKKSGGVYAVWAKRKESYGSTPDVVAEELRELGFPIQSENPADIFFEIHDAYKNAAQAIKKKADVFLKDSLTSDEIKETKQRIVKEILRGFDTTGEPSLLAKETNRYESEIKRLKTDLKGAHLLNNETNRVLDLIRKIDELKKGTFLNASQLKDDRFRGSIERITKIRYQGNLIKGDSIRKELGNLWSWYVDPDNKLFTKENGFFAEDIALTLQGLSNGKGNFTLKEMEYLKDVLSYFKTTIENFNKVYRDGKYVDAVPLAEKYVERIQTVNYTKNGVLKTLRSYFRTFGDPASVMRFADHYDEKGFFTETFESLREGAIGAAETEMTLGQEWNEYFSEKEAKEYREHFTNDTVNYNGEEIPVRVGISLYMTLKRRQAWAGLCRSGVQVALDGERTKLSALSSDPDVNLSEAEMKQMTETAANELFSQFTDQDKALIQIVEQSFEKCSSLKEQTDMTRLGRSNVMRMGYYFPLKRANVSQNVDNFFMEADRVSHLGFNQDTVQGAAGELLIEPLDIVFKRHIKGIAMYSNLAVATDNLNRLLNLNTVENHNTPVSILSEIKRTSFGNEMYDYLDKLKKDIEGIPKDEKDIKEFNRVVGVLRSGYAKYQLGANPKVWFTQLSSFAASTGILDYDSVLRGISVRDTFKEVDKYCSLAKLRHEENAVALAQGVLEQTGKIGDILMKPISGVDRLVIANLFGACQIQIQKDKGLKLDSEENKKAAGELLQKVILETQQNSIATERSSAMRSGNEFLKSFTMFSADAMKVTGRFIDSIGKISVIRHALKTADSDSKGALESELKKARKDFRKSLGAMVISAVMMAMIARGFRWLYRKDEDKTEEEIAWNISADFIGNMMGGLPILRDVYSFYVDGYEMENFLYSTVNDTLESFNGVRELAESASNGDKISNRDIASRIRKLIYSGSQLVGIPTRNAFNVVSGLLNRFDPASGYWLDSQFYKNNYASDLEKAIEAEDEKMVAMIAALMTEEKVGSENEKTIEAIRGLVAEGHTKVLPRVLGDTVTYEGEEIELTAKQKKRFREVYDVADESVDALVQLKEFGKADSVVQAKAIRFIYDVYYNLAVEDLVGAESGKNTLFAEAIDIEKLAIIVCTAHTLESDKDKKGKTINGSKKEKVVSYVESLRLSAAEKYMVLGYLGYKNLNGKDRVRAYINRMKLTKEEKQRLMEYSGYTAA